MNRFKIYIARKISGADGEETFTWYDNVITHLEYWGYQTLSPLTGKGVLRTEVKYAPHGYDLPVASDHAIFERDKWMVQNCDIVLMDLSMTTSPSIGCMFELAWASFLGKHTVVVIPKDNCHRHAFVIEGADIVFEDLETAMKYLESVAGGEDE